MAGDERVYRDRLKQMRMDISKMVHYTQNNVVKAKWNRHIKTIDDVLKEHLKEPEE